MLLLLAIPLLWLRLSPGWFSPAVEVPVPSDPKGLQAQLRAYVDEQVTWVRQAPRDARRQATLGIVYAANGLWREARLAFENAVRLNPREPLAQLYVAVATQELGETDEALALLRRLTEQFPDFPQGFCRLGEATLRVGAVDEAESAFRRLISLAPSEWRGYAGLGEVLLRRGQAAEAAQQLERALQLDPEAGNAHHLLGLAYRSLGRLDEAQLHLRLGLDHLSYPMPDAWNRTAHEHMRLIPDQVAKAENYLQKGLPAQAIITLQIALSYDPTNVSLLNQLAMTLHRAGQQDKASKLARQVLQLDNRNVLAHVTLSFSSQAEGSNDLALAWAEKAIALAPNTVECYLAKANALLGLERDNEAVAALQAALRCDPQNPGLLVHIGDICWHNLKQETQALEAYRQARQLDPSLVDASERLAELHLKRGETNEAESAIAWLKKINPGNPAASELENELTHGRPQGGKP